MKIINSYCDKELDMKQHQKRLRNIKLMKFKFLIVSLFGGNKAKNSFIRRNKIFSQFGENVLFQPYKLPNNTKLIKIHNNVRIAADVTFYEHDVINEVFSSMDNTGYISHMDCIEIFDNVFIGGKSIILGGVKIGPNAIIGAGSVVTKNVKEGTIVAGNPAKVIGTFDNLHEMRKSDKTSNNGNLKILERYNQLWKDFDDRG